MLYVAFITPRRLRCYFLHSAAGTAAGAAGSGYSRLVHHQPTCHMIRIFRVALLLLQVLLRVLQAAAIYVWTPFGSVAGARVACRTAVDNMLPFALLLLHSAAGAAACAAGSGYSRLGGIAGCSAALKELVLLPLQLPELFAK
jgi:hypothetical protein